jgi:hypothetical protein
MVACWQLHGEPVDAQFTDQTQSAGIDFRQTYGGQKKDFIVEAHGSGAGFLDHDGDGDIDLYIVNGSTFDTYVERSGPGNALYANQGDGTFTEIAEQEGVADPGWGSGVTAGDVDGDGLLDLYVTNFGANVLYRNSISNGFADETGDAGVAGDDYSTSAAFFDYDGDGDLDLYVVNYLELNLETTRPRGCNYIGDVNVYCGPQGMPGAADVLYRNEGQFRFVDVTDETGISAANRHYGLGVAPEDFDGDGHTDLYVANDSMPNVLFRNQGDGTFEDVALLSGIAYNSDGDEEAGMGVDFGDYDDDGDQDLYVTNFFRESNTLYRNDGAVGFTDRTVRAGLEAPTMTRLGWGTHFFDYDSDADLDLFVANGHVFPQVDRVPMGASYGQRNQLFRNGGGGRFKDISALAGPGMQVEKVSRGACFGDYDDDGDVDVLVVNLNDSPTLLRNDYPLARHRLAVQLIGTGIVDGTGATVRATIGDHVQTRTVRGASSYMSYNDTRVFFGLDGEDEVDLLEVVWPGGKEIQRFVDVEADQLIVIKQGQVAIESRSLW